MRSFPFIFIATLAYATTSQLPGPQLPVLKGLNHHFSVPTQAYSFKMKLGLAAHNLSTNPLPTIEPKLYKPFIPYPRQVPSKYQGIFYAQ